MSKVSRQPRNAIRQLPEQEANEAGSLAKLVLKQSMKACTPLKFDRIHGPGEPIPLAVGRNEKGCLVLQFFRRPDVSVTKGEQVVADVLGEQFGAPPASMERTTDNQLMEVFYRDEQEIKEKMELPVKVLEADSWYVEFPVGYSTILPDSATLSRDLALKIKTAWSKSIT